MTSHQAYPQTPAGVIEVKQLSEALVMEAKEPGKNYFNRGRDATPFMKLFRYIQTNKIPMTVPVEVNVENNEMLFYATPDSEAGTLENQQDVNIRTLPDRTVVSIGLRGQYSQVNYDKGKAKLQIWLQSHPEWNAIGKPYAVYWNAPYTLPFLKHSEVHIAIELIN